VPASYVGVWKRTLLATPTLRDTSTRVFWLQTDLWHADIRIPEDRPATRGDALDLLDRTALCALSRQQGFAGITEVQGDICRWHRLIDYQPPGRFADVGRMRFETPDRLLEYGVEQEYFEIWERVHGSAGAGEMFDLAGPSLPRRVLLRAGAFMMLVQDRSHPLPAADNLEALSSQASNADLAAALNLEISFGRIENADFWRIELSTLPWREGKRLALCADTRFDLTPADA
jgi:hypothetical protein